MAKRVKFLRAPWNYYWPHASAVSVVRETGPVLLKDQMAEAAIREGYAVPFEPEKKATPRRVSATRRRNAADTGQPDRVGPADILPHGGPVDSAPVADAG
jgi:hypothetical protein